MARHEQHVNAPIQRVIALLESVTMAPTFGGLSQRVREQMDEILSQANAEGVWTDADLGSLARSLAGAGFDDTIVGQVVRRASKLADGRGTTTPGESGAIALHHLRTMVQVAACELPISERLSRIAQSICHAAGTDACTIFLHDEATHSLALRGAWGMDPATIGAVTLRVGTGIAGQAALEQQTIVASDAHAHQHFLDHPGLGDEQFVSQISTPMVASGPRRLVGVLSVHTRQTQETTPAIIDFLESAAGLLGVTIDGERHSSQTDNELQRKVTELATLQRVSRLVASTLDLSEVLKLITEQAVELINAEAAAIFRLPEGRDTGATPRPTIEYRIGRLRNHEDESDRDMVVREVLRTGVARTRDISYVDGINSVFCLPLNTARETVGALCFRLRLGTVLDEEQLGLLQAFGDAAALAIDNARLYQEAIRSIQTQSTLVQEMHHRVRNNLQTVAALLSLQLRSDEDAPWTHELREAISRIQSIAAVHDLMSDASRLAGTTVDVIARMVAEDAHSTLIPTGRNVRFVIPPSRLTVPSRQATIIALLINELAANAIHHGFANRPSGTITINAYREAEMAVIEVANDGVRISESFEPATSSGLGMRITQRLVTSDLGGTFTIKPTSDGTLATIRFPMRSMNGDTESLAHPPA